jgi:anti-anti-sigma regulatory factor
MGACSIQTERERGRTVVRLAGVFDHASAFELHERLEREPDGDLVLDFSSVRELADLGVAALAHGLAAGERRLRLRGLRRRQIAIFRYFGVALM